MSRALVIKNYFPARNRVKILHEEFGMISLFVYEKSPAASLCNGSLIYCHVVKKKNRYDCQFVDPYFVPFESASCDLYFVHNLLKICLNYLPQETDLAEIFILLVEIYQNMSSFSALQKKRNLLKLFLYAGIFPHDQRLYQAVMLHDSREDAAQNDIFTTALDYCWQRDEMMQD